MNIAPLLSTDLHWDSGPEPAPLGQTPTLLAAGLGVLPEVALVHMTAVLGGLAGPHAWMGGALDERHRPALPLILLSGHPGRTRALEQMMVEPAIRFTDRRRADAMAYMPERFQSDETFPGSRVIMEQKRQFESLAERPLLGDESCETPRIILAQRQCRQPSLMITSPTPETYDEVRGSVFDEAPLVFDPAGNLICQALQPGKPQPLWRALLRRIVEGSRWGLDQPAGASSAPRLNAISRTLTPLLIHLGPDWLAPMLADPVVATVLETAILIDSPETVQSPHRPAIDYQAAREVALRYREAVGRVLQARVNTGGIGFQLKVLPPGLVEGQHEIEQRLDGLPPAIARHCWGLYDLPLRLLWASLVVDDPHGRHAPDHWVPGVLWTARWCVDRQVRLIGEALEAERRRKLLDAARLMFQKLLDLPQPCRLADLVRRFHCQQRERHMPVLELLDHEGGLSWDPHANQIQLLVRKLPERLAPATPSR
jgi:hypothetical protein